jgi:hypothetical protein
MVQNHWGGRNTLHFQIASVIAQAVENPQFECLAYFPEESVGDQHRNKSEAKGWKNAHDTSRTL